jgi:3D (Asp-Asp-Asp) domain-containing protein
VFITRSLWRKALVTVVAAGGFVALYEATILDSKFSLRQTSNEGATEPPAPGSRVSFTATAYCKGLVTAAGVAPQSGVAAADPAVLPLGSVVELDAPGSQQDGLYTILDTGPAVQGRLVDLYMWSCNEALQFGRRPVKLTVLRLGWNPHATTPPFMERLFKRPAPAPLPSHPFPPTP